MAKDFSNMATGKMFNAMAEATKEPTETKEPAKKKYKDRKTYTDEQALEAMNNMATTGMKGVKMPRINLAFTPDNYEYIQVMARVSGTTLTGFINKIIESYRTEPERQELYEQAKKFKDSL